MAPVGCWLSPNYSIMRRRDPCEPTEKSAVYSLLIHGQRTEPVGPNDQNIYLFTARNRPWGYGRVSGESTKPICA